MAKNDPADKPTSAKEVFSKTSAEPTSPSPKKESDNSGEWHEGVDWEDVSRAASPWIARSF